MSMENVPYLCGIMSPFGMGYLAQVQSLHRVCDVSNNQSYNISQPIQLPLLEEFPGNPGPIKRRKKEFHWIRSHRSISGSIGGANFLA
ncbi:hypothetical protein QQG55_18830 [Brugia pahangi]